MRNLIHVILFFSLTTSGQTITTLTELKAFSSSEGFGKNSTHARGKSVFKVTNLNDSGAGSRRQALSDATSAGGGYIIYEVAGTITQASSMEIPDSTYDAGQTAFRNGGQGITLRQNGTYNSTLVSNIGNNSVIRFIRFRRGAGINEEVNGDNLRILSNNNIILDHCSISWGTDGNFDISGADANLITLQNSIVSEALMYSTHANSTDVDDPSYPSPHSMGMLITDGSSEVSLYRNYFAHNNQRNPLIGGDPNPATDFELVNHIVYNSGSFPLVISGGSTGNFNVNIIKSRVKDGTNTSTSRSSIMAQALNSDRYYVEGNITPDRPTSGDPEWDAIRTSISPYTATLSTTYQSLTPFDYPLNDAPTYTIAELEDEGLSQMGASLYEDAVDARIKADFINGTGSLIDDPSEVGGWPTLADMSSVPTDTDDDGIPDDFETEHSITDANGVKTDWYFSADDHYVTNTAGYTNIEMYLMSLTGELMEGAVPYEPEPELSLTPTIPRIGGMIKVGNGNIKVISN